MRKLQRNLHEVQQPISIPAMAVTWAPAKPCPIPRRILSALRRQVAIFTAEHQRHPRCGVLHVTPDGSDLLAIEFEPADIAS